MASASDRESQSIETEASTMALESDANPNTGNPPDATCDIEPATYVADASQGATIALEPDSTPSSPDAAGLATCDLAPGEPGPEFVTAATIAFEPNAQSQPIGDATCDVESDADSGRMADLATCDLDASKIGDATCDVDSDNPVTESHRRPTFDLQTNSIPKNVTGGLSPRGETSLKDGKETHAKTAGRQTSQRVAGEVTNSASIGDAANQVVPQQAGRFVFKKFHAKGGMGEVWLCEDADIGRPVALKRMLKGRQKHKNQFIKEAQVTGQLEHPGVIPVHELSIDENGQPYYVMKFVHGKTLKDVIRDFHNRANNADSSREVAWLQLMNVLIDLCQTVAYAHSRGVIHRDIKPDNVMVGAYGETLVLDWGLAKVIGEPESDDPYAGIQVSQFADTQASISGSIKGTPFYFAPEVASGEVERVDEISDVYLLGGTLYEMVTGKPPRKADRMPELLEMARTVAPTPPRQLDPTVPKPLDAICRKALAMRKEDRYQKATDLAEDMQRYLAGEPVSAYPESLTERTWRWIKRHRTALSRTAAAAVILAIGLTAFELIRSAEARRVEAIAEAALLKERDQARLDIAAFRSLAEEARYYAASADPVAESVPALDEGKVDVKAKAALAIADAWGPMLEKMPLTDKHPHLKKDLYDLLLELAQMKIRRADIEEVKGVQALLERAATYQKPTQSFYRLRARTYDALGQQALAAADRKTEADPQTPANVMDHYLVGEQHRVDSLKRTIDDLTAGKQAGIKGLLARRESLNKAIAAYRQALRSDPNHYWSHFQLGTCYNGLGQYAEAAEALGACIVLLADKPWGYSARGLALALAGDARLSEAEADLNEALRIDADFRPARLHRAAYYARQEKYAEAEADFNLLLSGPKDKRMREAAFARGKMSMDRGMFDQALADFDDVVESGLKIRAVYLHRARIYLVQEAPAKALENLNLFLAAEGKIDPESARAYEQRGRELRLIASELPEKARNRREGVYLLAMDQLQKAAKFGGANGSLFDEIGSVEEKLAGLQPKQALARMQAAIAAYSKGIEYAPKDLKLHVKRGWARIALDQIGQAKDDFQAAVAIDANDAESHTGLGYTEAMLKAPGAARRHAALATMHAAGDYLVLHNVACIYGALSKSEPGRAKEHQDITLDHIRRAVELWIKGGRNEPNEIHLIRNESAFSPALRDRREFKKILEDEK